MKRMKRFAVGSLIVGACSLVVLPMLFFPEAFAAMIGVGAVYLMGLSAEEIRK